MGFCHWCIAQDRQGRAPHLEPLGRAQRNFEQAVLLSGPERLECWAWAKLWLGRVCLEQGETDAAVEHFGEAHLASGEVWLSRHRLERVYETASAAVRAGDGEALVDDGWGGSLSHREVAARARFGCAYWTALIEGDLREGLAMARDPAALARGVGNLRGRALSLARCLDVEARILAEHGRLDEAIALSHEAAALRPAPDMLLHELRLFDATAGIAGNGRVSALVRGGTIVTARHGERLGRGARPLGQRCCP